MNNSVDNDLDWNMKNDNDSSIDSEKVNVIKNPNWVILELWEFSELINKKISVNIETKDWAKNIYELNLEVYTPTPEILDYSTNGITWNIDESLSWEPINIYRVRGWVVTKLENTDGLDKVVTQDWWYNFWLSKDKTWIQIEKDKKIIAQVNESTWKIYVKDPKYSIKVLSSNDKINDKVYPKIVLKDLNEDIFYETLKVSGNKEINIVNDFEGISKNDTWLYIRLYNASDYSFNLIPLNAPSGWWNLIVYRPWSPEESLFTIFRDWKINTLNENYTLEYDSFDSYIIIRLNDKHYNKKVADILYKINSDYLIQ